MSEKEAWARTAVDEEEVCSLVDRTSRGCLS